MLDAGRTHRGIRRARRTFGMAVSGISRVIALLLFLS